MGKYMRKSKIAGDVAVMELSQSTSLGVRTRARTLALQRLQSSSPPTTASAAANSDTTSYLQLRSRRLEKPPPPSPSPSPKSAIMQHGQTKKVVSKGGLRSVKSSGCEKERSSEGYFGEKEEMLSWKCKSEASFGENCLDFEPRERSTRESTPCSLIRETDTIQTPGSTTRQRSSDASNRRIPNDRWRNIPTTHEMDEFFSCAEQQQQRVFIDKYNFDVANDVPLLGRYEWVQVIP